MPRPSPRLRASLSAVAFLVACGVAAALLLRSPNPDRIFLARSDAFVLGAFLAGLALVAGAGLRLLVHGTRHLLRRPGPHLPLASVVAVLVANGVLVALGVLARYHVPFQLRVVEHRVALPGLSAPVRLVLWSDLHSDARFDLDARVAGQVNALDPDVVLFAGDALNRADRLDAFRAALGAIRAPARFALRGNWDAWFWLDLDLFGGTGFEEIRDGWRTVETPGGSVHLGGHTWLDGWDPDRILGDIPAVGPRIFSYHAHDYLEEALARGVDLYLCGDTHGGQVALPGYGALFAIGRAGRRFARGPFVEGAGTGYVTSGVGVEAGFPLRFGVPPEIVLLVLEPASSARAPSPAPAGDPP